MATLQGQDNLVFTGDAFSGSGVPAVASFCQFLPPHLVPGRGRPLTPATENDDDDSSSAVSSFYEACVATWCALLLFRR